MKSIKNRLITLFGSMFLIGFLVFGFIAVYIAGNALEEEATDALTLITEEASEVVEARVETQIRTLEMIAGRRGIQGMRFFEQRGILNNELENTAFLDLGVADLEGNLDLVSGRSVNISGEDYFQLALDSNHSQVSDVYLNDSTSNPELAYIVPIERNGNTVGFLVGRRNGFGLSNITDEIRYGEEGYAYVINQQGTTVAHRNREFITTGFNPIEGAAEDPSLEPVAEVLRQALEERTGIGQYDYQGDSLFAAFNPIEGTQWTLVVTANSNEVLSGVATMRNALIPVTAILLVVAATATYIIGSNIAKPLTAIKEEALRLSDLDLTQDVDSKIRERRDEVGILGTAFQEILNNLREVLASVQDSSEKVSASSEELTATSQQSATAADEVARTVEEIAKSAADQAQSAEEGSEKGLQLGNSIDENQNHIKALNQANETVNRAVREGLSEIDTLTEISQESHEKTKEVQNGIENTNLSAEKIGQASNVIASISEQTNLLALNAAIEAARAGEAGKGFAVVAEEIRKLAEESASSTQTIDTVVQELQGNSQQAVYTMNSVATILEQQRDKVLDTKEKYNTIAEATRASDEGLEKLNLSGVDMEAMKTEILDALQNLSAIAEENSAGTEEMSASVEEQASSAEELSSASEGLSTLAEELHQVLKRFKI